MRRFVYPLDDESESVGSKLVDGAYTFKVEVSRNEDENGLEVDLFYELKGSMPCDDDAVGMFLGVLQKFREPREGEGAA